MYVQIPYADYKWDIRGKSILESEFKHLCDSKLLPVQWYDNTFSSHSNFYSTHSWEVQGSAFIASSEVTREGSTKQLSQAQRHLFLLQYSPNGFCSMTIPDWVIIEIQPSATIFSHLCIYFIFIFILLNKVTGKTKQSKKSMWFLQ